MNGSNIGTRNKAMDTFHDPSLTPPPRPPPAINIVSEVWYLYAILTHHGPYPPPHR